MLFVAISECQFWAIDLLIIGFIGELEASSAGTTIVEKTHGFGKGTIERYDRAILLVRNPYDAIVSAYNRLLTKDTSHSAPLSAFSTRGTKRLRLRSIA